MGVVYEAEDLKLGRRVALKFLGSDCVGSDRNRNRFLREARSAAALNHPNICTVHEVDEADGQLFIAMEYCEGCSLKELISQGPLEIRKAISIGIQVASALAEAHRRQIVHRDVKSSNIMVDAKNRARMLDFGLATAGESTEETLTMQIMGTPAYMAPERFKLQVSDPAGDIWALGVVLYEAIAGRMPFGGGNYSQIAHSAINDHPAPLSSVRPDSPPALDDIIEKALAKDPADRYQSAEEMAADLGTLANEGKPDAARLITASVSALPAALRIQSVAVLPFLNMSQNAEDDFLSDGLTEEIANALTQVRGLRVASRASTFQFKSPSLDLRDVGRKLRATALVLGSVRRAAGRLRVIAQLVNSADGYQIWSHRFDCEMKDVFDLEDQLTAAIVDHLRQWLHADLELAAWRGGASDAGAHECYLRGRHAFNLQTARGLEDALGFFAQAVEAAPRYALAHVGMADCYASQGWYGFRAPAEVMPKAKAELDDAIAIEEALPSAWRLRAVVSSGFDWDWDRARAEFERAFALGPPSSELRFHYALDFLTPLQRLDEALHEIKLALELDPAAPLLGTALGGCLYRMRLYPAALRQLKATLELTPGFYHAYWSMARVYQQQGLYTEAIDYYERARAAGGGGPAFLADLGHCRATMGDKGGAREILEQVAAAPLSRAIVRLGLNDVEGALEDLRQAVEERVRALIWVGVEPRFDAVRELPRFREVIAPVGLPPNRAPYFTMN